VRGMNDEEVAQLAALTIDRPWEMRFIEVMPLTGVADVANDGVVKSAELIERLQAEFGPFEDLGHTPADSARRYRIPGARGKLGFISSVSEPFCATCNRMRLTSDGRLHLCLLRDDEVDLRAAIRGGATEEEIEQIIRHGVAIKPWGHGLPEGVLPSLRGMSALGG
jgi:GTP 3',8-cyclase